VAGQGAGQAEREAAGKDDGQRGERVRQGAGAFGRSCTVSGCEVRGLTKASAMASTVACLDGARAYHTRTVHRCGIRPSRPRRH